MQPCRPIPSPREGHPSSCTMHGGLASTEMQPPAPVELRDQLDTRCPCSGALSLQYLQSSKDFSGTLGFYLVTEASKCRPHRLSGTLILCFLGFRKQMIRNVRKVNISFCLTQLHYSGLLNQQVLGQLKILSTTHFFHLVKEKPTLCLILFITSLSSKRECSQTKKMSLFFFVFFSFSFDSAAYRDPDLARSRNPV